MIVYVFGNPDASIDKGAFIAVDKLKINYPNFYKSVEFRVVKPNADLPFDTGENVILLDVVQGINKVELIANNQIDYLTTSPRTSVHDFDLGFQLKYLKKLGKIGRVTIIGIPAQGEPDYKRIHSILRKLVAQDMHGS